MRIFLATARLDDIRWAAEHGLADGVLTTPALLDAASSGDPRGLLADLCRATSLPVCATVGAVSGADIYRDARELAKLSDHVIVQIPLVEDAVSAIRKLSAEGVRVGATLVFNAAQAILAAKAGASMIATALDQLDLYGHDGLQVVSELRSVFADGRVECDVMALYPRDATQFAGCAIAGADVVALPPQLVKSLLLHPLTDRGLDQFLNELARGHRGRTP
jgi:transaldolase